MPPVETTQETPAAKTEVSFSDLKSMLSGETPAEKPAESAEKQPSADHSEEQSKKTDSGSETENKQERDETGKFKPKANEEGHEVPEGVQKRIDKAVRKQREAERERDELRAELEKARGADPAKQKTELPAKPPTSEKPARPKLDQFDTYEQYEAALDDYQEKLTDWKIEKRQQDDKDKAQKNAETEKQESVKQAWSQSIEEARSQHKDFDEAMEDIADMAIPDYVFASVMEAGAELAYQLAKQPAELARIAKLSPMAALREIGKFEAKLTPSSTPEHKEPRKVTSAPKPPAKVDSEGPAPKAVDLNDPKTPMAEWKKAYLK